MTVQSYTPSIAAVVALAASAALAEPPVQLRQYDTRYYTIYTDLPPAAVPEVAQRMGRMVDEYHERTKSFSGVIQGKFPFYLYRHPADYFAAGGIQRSAGAFLWDGQGGAKLMAVAGDRLTAATWHIVQHEGFHQFAHAVIGGDIPTWMNEGLADYFGEALYTGDGFVTGIVPPWRLVRLKTEIERGQVKPFRDLMALDGEHWNREMAAVNYDQAWSMVHFLVHADGGRYAPAFSQCIRRLSQGWTPRAAWDDAVGSTDGFEDRWKAYWLAQPRSPTHDLYARATVATLTSFLARATAARQAFPDLPAFVAAAQGDQIRMAQVDWLPHSLLSDALRTAGEMSGDGPDDGAVADGPTGPRWLYRRQPGRQPTLTYRLDDGTRLTGWFVLNGSRVGSVNVEVDDVAKVVAAATPLRDARRLADAQAMVRAALRQHPLSPDAADARKFLLSCR